MKHVADIETIATEAISANWGHRNARFTNIDASNQRMIRQRKQQLREWVAVLRTVRNPDNHDPVKAAVIENKDGRVGPLMAHDLRRRVIDAGVDAFIARFERRQAASHSGSLAAVA